MRAPKAFHQGRHDVARTHEADHKRTEQRAGGSRVVPYAEVVLQQGKDAGRQYPGEEDGQLRAEGEGGGNHADHGRGDN